MRVIALALLVGCGFPQLPPLTLDGPTGGDAPASGSDAGPDAPLTGYKAAATWTFRTATGATMACPSGVTIATITSQPVDASGNPNGNPTTNAFDCAASTGTTSLLTPDHYEESIAMSGGGPGPYATSLPQILDLTAADKTFTVTIITDGGYFHVQWGLFGMSSGQLITCAQAGAASFDVTSTLTTDNTKVYDHIFPCTDGQGITSPIPAGTYTVSLAALNAANQSLGAVTQTNKAIQAPNALTDLGAVTVAIPGH